MMTIDRTTPLEQLPSMLRVPEVARWADVSPGVVYDAVRRGTLQSVTFGRIIRIPKTELQSWLGGHNGNGDA